MSPVAQLHQYLLPQRKDTTVNKWVSVQSRRHFPSNTLTLSGSLESDFLSDGILTNGSDSNNKELVEVVEHHVCPGTCTKSCGGCQYDNPLQRGRTSSPLRSSGSSNGLGCSSTSSMEEDSDNDNSMSMSSKKAEFEPRGGMPKDHPPTQVDLKSPPKVHRGLIPSGTYTALLDNCNDDILDGVWPGLHDIQLLTCFVMTHFSGDWTSYLHFAKWADSRLLTAPGSLILLEGWLQSKYGREDGLRDGAASKTRYRLGSLGGIVMDNMCNKTCDPPLLTVGDVVSTFKTPTKCSSSTPCYINIRKLFPAVACTQTLQELAMDQMMEEEIVLQ